MSLDSRRLWAATAAIASRQASQLLPLVRAGGWPALERVAREGPPVAQARAEDTARQLTDRAVGVLAHGDADYPLGLTELATPPPIVYYMGDLAILKSPSVGMCGSRHASDVGVRAAQACGNAVARAGLTIVSGYARGVDTETHLAALRNGGQTIVVLAEGFMHFRIKRALGSEFDPSRVLVVSQFAPRQTWNVGAAMTRNAIIAGLGRALVVVEANGSGGTLDAGLQALAMKKPVLALEFENGPTPEGNRVLIDRGAIPVRRPSELTDRIAAMRDPTGAAENLSFSLP